MVSNQAQRTGKDDRHGRHVAATAPHSPYHFHARDLGVFQLTVQLLLQSLCALAQAAGRSRDFQQQGIAEVSQHTLELRAARGVLRYQQIEREVDVARPEPQYIRVRRAQQRVERHAAFPCA
ncbi:hypothetical protein D3C87_1034840 [compost metagenome]